MPKKVREDPPEAEPPKIPKKKGRPRKYPLPSQPAAPAPSKKDDQIITKFLRQALAARRIDSLLELYEQRPQLIKYILESYHFGELHSLEAKPDIRYLEEKALDCFRDMH
jgi:hypothetical protein